MRILWQQDLDEDEAHENVVPGNGEEGSSSRTVIYVNKLECW